MEADASGDRPLPAGLAVNGAAVPVPSRLVVAGVGGAIGDVVHGVWIAEASGTQHQLVGEDLVAVQLHDACDAREALAGASVAGFLHQPPAAGVVTGLLGEGRKAEQARRVPCLGRLNEPAARGSKVVAPEGKQAEQRAGVAVTIGCGALQILWSLKVIRSVQQATSFPIGAGRAGQRGNDMGRS